MPNNRRSIVTGGAGFIGSALVRHLVAKGEEVLTIDALTYAGNMASLKAVEGKANHRFLHADIRDAAAMNAAIRDFAPTCILHLAAESHVDRSITGAGDFISTNVVGTFTLLEAACGYWQGLAAAEKEAAEKKACSERSCMAACTRSSACARCRLSGCFTTPGATAGPCRSRRRVTRIPRVEADAPRPPAGRVERPGVGRVAGVVLQGAGVP